MPHTGIHPAKSIGKFHSSTLIVKERAVVMAQSTMHTAQSAMHTAQSAIFSLCLNI
jgi:hypothetical protein